MFESLICIRDELSPKHIIELAYNELYYFIKRYDKGRIFTYLRA
jgi:hypothetical protein